MCKGRKSNMIIGALLAAVLLLCTLIIPLQSAFAYDASGAVAVNRGSYYDLPQTVSKYVSSGKTIEFDLNKLIKDTDVCKLGLYNGNTFVSSEFTLHDGEEGLNMITEPLSDGWYHYIISLASVPHSEEQENSAVTRIRARSTFPAGTMINNLSVDIDVRALPEAFTEDYDTVTLADLGIAGNDYKTPVSSGTYTYNGKSETKSVIVKFGWEANISPEVDWKLALDTYWNSSCLLWFRPDAIYFCPGEGTFKELYVKADPVTGGKHDVEFGRLRVTAGPNYGTDYVFAKIDGEIRAEKYTHYYQTEGGYVAYSDKKTTPSYTVCFVGDGVSKQGFSGFAKPDEYVTDIDYINIGDIVPGGVVKDTVHDGHLGYTYPCELNSETNSTVVRYVLKVGDYEKEQYEGSVMVVDIGGNCGFCRSYISAGNKKSIMFGWEIEGCTNGTKNYKFDSNTWYAFEQGRLRVTSGANKGKDFVYIKIDGEIVSSFYANPESRPLFADQIYVEATQNFQIVGYNELRAKYYVDGELYYDKLAQKGFTAKKPGDPKKDGSYFVGWYTANEGGTLFDFENTKLNSDINLYARFTAETVTATFNPANGSAATELKVGKNCLFKAPEAPSYSDGQYEYVFAGWKNETTGKIFDFAVDRLNADTVFTAQYKEKEYHISYYASGKLVDKVSFVLSNPTVSGREPAVPAIPNATGAWEKHSVSGLKKSMTVNAVYTVTAPAASDAISLSTYAGSKIYLNTDTVHDYLSTENAADQTAFVKEFCATPHEYQDHQNASFFWSDSGNNESYTVYFADNKDFKNAYIIVTDKTSLTDEVGIFIPGNTYYWFVCGNSTGKSSAVDSFTVVNTPVRYITAGSVINMRDLGGQINSDGKRVKYELVYRGAALDEYISHIDDAARNIFNYLGINSEIELRGGMQHDFTGWDENDSDAYYIKGAMYQEILSLDSEQKAQYKAVFDAMADKNNYPFYFHCSAGADRTGTFAYLLYGLLGISYDDIRPEYELTSFSAIGLRSADHNTSDQSLDKTKQLMIEQYGDGTGNLQTAVQNFLKDYIGVSKANLESIKDIMLDKNTAANEKPYTITVDVLGKKYTYQAFDGIYFMPDTPEAMGKIFKGFYHGTTEYNGYPTGNINLTAKFEDIEYEPYDTITLRDLGVQEEKILNKTNTVYTYNKTSASGGRLFRFVMEPIGDMNKGDGPQIALTNDWSKNNYARAWFQTNTMTHIYYNGTLNNPPDISKVLSLEPGKKYEIEFAVRVMKNKGYAGKKVFEVTVNGELVAQYIGCEADLSENKIYFHGSTGSVYLRNLTDYKIHTVTVDVMGKKFNYPAFEGVYSMPDSPQVAGKLFKGFYSGSTKYNGYATENMSVTAKFEDMEYEPFDTVTLRDLGVQEEKIINQPNTVYTYNKTSASGGRLFRFIMEPIGDMNKGDGPQISFTNDWNKNSSARVWFQSNTQTQVYYSGGLNSPPSMTKQLSLEPGKFYNVEYSVRIIKNKGYEGVKVFEVTVDGELVTQYFGCTADLSENKIYMHGSAGSVYLRNLTPHKTHTITVDVLGKKFNYPAFEGVYSMPDAPQVAGKLFKGFYCGSSKYNGYATENLSVTAKFEDIEYEPYDTISLKDLGIKEDKILNQTNTVYTYEKTAESGGRLFRFIMEPIGNMKNGDGPQIALINNWAENSAARVWFQSNTQTQVYYHGVLNAPPSISKKLSLEPGNRYNVEYSVRIMKNKGYEGMKIFEVTVDGELVVQYIGCSADLSENIIYLHGGTGAAYLINKPVYKTVNFYNGNILIASHNVERCGLLPKVEEPAPKGGLPFAGWYTKATGGKLWDENADLVYNDMNLYAHFADVRIIKANVDGKILTYRLGVGKTLDELPKPEKSGHLFMGWLENGRLFTGRITKNINITASFEPYSFDDYDEISLRDLGISGDLDFAIFGERHTSGYNYYKAAKTGGRVFKAIYIPTENMINGPQVSFSTKWDENYFSKLYFTKYDKLYVYSSGIDGGLPTFTMSTELTGGKEYMFEIGVRVLNNKGYKGIKVLTVYLNGELIFEEFDNKTNLEGDTVFFQGLPDTGIFRNIDIYKTVSFYDGDKRLSSVKTLRGKTVKSIGNLPDRGDRLFVGWFTEFGQEWNFGSNCVYIDTVLKARFQKRTYPVLLMVDNVLYKRLNICAGECAEIFDIPTKEGYEFDKWLSVDGTEYDFMKPVNAPIVLNASFKKFAGNAAAISDNAESISNNKWIASDLLYILLGIIGIAVIVSEIFIIIHKKRFKAQ